jgi:hypothetical protein
MPLLSYVRDINKLIWTSLINYVLLVLPYSVLIFYTNYIRKRVKVKPQKKNCCQTLLGDASFPPLPLPRVTIAAARITAQRSCSKSDAFGISKRLFRPESAPKADPNRGLVNSDEFLCMNREEVAGFSLGHNFWISK